MKIITLSPTVRLKVDQWQYSPEVWFVPEKDSKAQARWIATGTHHPSLSSAIKYLAKKELISEDEDVTFMEYLDSFIAKEKELLKGVK